MKSSIRHPRDCIGMGARLDMSYSQRLNSGKPLGIAVVGGIQSRRGQLGYFLLE